jgi:hypothetical protein
MHSRTATAFVATSDLFEVWQFFPEEHYSDATTADAFLKPQPLWTSGSDKVALDIVLGIMGLN